MRGLGAYEAVVFGDEDLSWKFYSLRSIENVVAQNYFKATRKDRASHGAEGGFNEVHKFRGRILFEHEFAGDPFRGLKAHRYWSKQADEGNNRR